jgi:hypothetical protein
MLLAIQSFLLLDNISATISSASVYISHIATLSTHPQRKKLPGLPAKIPNSSCGNRPRFLILPPTLDGLINEFSTMAPNHMLERSTLHCKFCGLLMVNKRATEADQDYRCLKRGDKDQVGRGADQGGHPGGDGERIA